jgi:hypothetical protein
MKTIRKDCDPATSDSALNRDQPVAEAATYTTNKETNIHVFSWIRTLNPSTAIWICKKCSLIDKIYARNYRY